MESPSAARLTPRGDSSLFATVDDRLEHRSTTFWGNLIMSRKTLLALTVSGLIGIVMQATADEIRVRDLPIPDGAADVSYMKRRGDIRFHVPSDFKTAGDFYAKKLAEQKW